MVQKARESDANHATAGSSGSPVCMTSSRAHSLLVAVDPVNARQTNSICRPSALPPSPPITMPTAHATRSTIFKLSRNTISARFARVRSASPSLPLCGLQANCAANAHHQTPGGHSQIDIRRITFCHRCQNRSTCRGRNCETTALIAQAGMAVNKRPMAEFHACGECPSVGKTAVCPRPSVSIHRPERHRTALPAGRGRVGYMRPFAAYSGPKGQRSR